MAVSAAILEIFNVKEWPDLEIWVWGPGTHLRFLITLFKSIDNLTIKKIIVETADIALERLTCSELRKLGGGGLCETVDEALCVGGAGEVRLLWSGWSSLSQGNK